MADSTQNGPMAGGAGGGAVVRSCGPGAGPGAVLLRRVLPEGQRALLARVRAGTSSFRFPIESGLLGCRS